MIDHMYPLAPNAVFATIQGEGALLGLPTVFVRLAGCSIGCPQCDTDYTVAGRATAAEIADRVRALLTPARQWVWVTGGEPTDHELQPLLDALARTTASIALATSGLRPMRLLRPFVDFLSVSPHGRPADLQQRFGEQINLVPGLNGLRLADWQHFDASGFKYRYVTPCDGDPASLAQCLQWVNDHQDWRLGVQSHKSWGLP